jgi:hypothetical protein
VLYFAGLVLRDLVVGMLFAVFALTVGAAGLGYVHLVSRRALVVEFSCMFYQCSKSQLESSLMSRELHR